MSNFIKGAVVILAAAASAATATVSTICDSVGSKSSGCDGARGGANVSEIIGQTLSNRKKKS